MTLRRRAVRWLGTRHVLQNLLDGKLPTVADIGLTHKQVHEARQLRDAEEDDPGVVRRACGYQFAIAYRLRTEIWAQW